MLIIVVFLNFAVVFLILALGWSQNIEASSRTVTSYIDGNDLKRFQQVFIDAFDSNDLQGVYYAAMNIEPNSVNEKQILCKKIFKLHDQSKLKVSVFCLFKV